MNDGAVFQQSERLRDALITLVISVAHLALAVLVPVLLHDNRSEIIPFAMVGLYGGQITLIGLWSAVAVGPWITRVPWSLLAASGIWSSILLGNMLVGELTDSAAYQAFGYVIFGATFLVQIPLWVAARRFGWRLIPPHAASNPNVVSNRRFEISKLFLGTTLLACAIAVGRLFTPEGDWQLITFDPEMVFAVVVGAMVNAVTAVPSIWLAYVQRTTVWALVFWGVYLPALSGIEVLILSLGLGPPPANEMTAAFVAVYLFNLIQCATVYVTLLIMRKLGFQLMRPQRPQSRQLAHELSDA